jgi:hypothetical protein
MGPAYHSGSTTGASSTCPTAIFLVASTAQIPGLYSTGGDGPKPDLTVMTRAGLHGTDVPEGRSGDTRAIAPDLAIGMDSQTGPSPSDYAAVALARMDAPVFPALADAHLAMRNRKPTRASRDCWSTRPRPIRAGMCAPRRR